MPSGSQRAEVELLAARSLPYARTTRRQSLAGRARAARCCRPRRVRHGRRRRSASVPARTRSRLRRQRKSRRENHAARVASACRRARGLYYRRLHPTADSQSHVTDYEECRFCGGTLRFRLIDGTVRPLRGTCSCPQPGGPTKPLLQDKFCWRTECRFCGRRPVFFVRHNGGSVFFDELGYPWPKHDCLHGDDSVLERIRRSVKNIPGIRAADLYQVLESNYVPSARVLAVRLRDTNGRRTIWHIAQFEALSAAIGSIVALCRTAMVLIDGSGHVLQVNGPMVRCRRCNRWFRRSESFGHVCRA